MELQTKPLGSLSQADSGTVPSPNGPSALQSSPSLPKAGPCFRILPASWWAKSSQASPIMLCPNHREPWKEVPMPLGHKAANVESRRLWKRQGGRSLSWGLTSEAEAMSPRVH